MPITNESGVITETPVKSKDQFERTGVIRDDAFAIRDEHDQLKQIQFDASPQAAGKKVTIKTNASQTEDIEITLPASTGTLAAAGAANAFATIQPDTGTSPTADSSTDTLTLTSSDLSIAGDSTTDTITITAPNKVTGPGSATDNEVPRFDGTTGKLVQTSGVYINDSSQLGIGQSAPKVLLHASASTTSGSGGNGAVIIGKPHASNNVGTGAVIMNGSAGGNTASGTDCTTGGHSSTATGQDSFTFGESCTNAGNYSQAFGYTNSIAASTANTVFGSTNAVSNLANFSLCGGELAAMRAQWSIVWGRDATVDSNCHSSYAFGRRANARNVGVTMFCDSQGSGSWGGQLNQDRFCLVFAEGMDVIKSTSGGYTGPRWRHLLNNVNTTDATVTTLSSVTTDTDKKYTVQAQVVAKRTGGAAGASGDCASYTLVFNVKNVGGTVTVNGLTVTAVYEDQAGWDVTADASSTTWRLRVTGAADNNVTWHCKQEWTEV